MKKVPALHVLVLDDGEHGELFKGCWSGCEGAFEQDEERDQISGGPFIFPITFTPLTV